jgi:hypothetical protein
MEMKEQTKELTEKYPPKYLEIEKRFQNEYVLKDLQEKKKKLCEIRDFHKP